MSNCINSVTGQRTCAFLGMECDNNNDFDIASVKALDNKLCSEVCLPGEWQSAEHELDGRHPSAHPCSPHGALKSCAAALARKAREEARRPQEALGFTQRATPAPTVS